MKTSDSLDRMDASPMLTSSVGGAIEPSVYVKDLEAPIVALPVPQALAEHRYRLAAARLEASLDSRHHGNGNGKREARTLGRLVLVTSAEDGDGKTTTALHVATALSQAMGRRVALVEADTERPGLSNMLGLGSIRGLAEVLSGSASLDDVLLRGADDGPIIVPAGNDRGRASRPGALLGSLNALREYHDYVVVDCAAMSRSADTAVLGRAADGVVLVVRAGATSSYALSAALEALVDTPVLGCVLNDYDGLAGPTPSRSRGASSYTDED
jgi:Mrp family chromosome partitioning ATPase